MFDSYEAASQILARFHLLWTPASIAMLAEELDEVYATATAAERERCAQVAESQAGGHYMAQIAAAAIRALA